MSQHDLNIANQGFAAFRTDLNNALVALGGLQSGNSAPATTFANMFWMETDTNKLWLRNEDNDAWIEIFTLDQVNDKIASIGGVITLTSTGIDVTGDIVLGTSNGIDFGDAGGSGTANSNLLDDYEEGSWNPVFEGTTDAGTNTYDKQLGYYTKIGNLVTATLRIRTDALSGMTGNLRLAGLPFSVRNLAAGFDGAAGGIVIHQANTFGVNYPTSGYVVDNTSTVLLSYVSAINADPTSLTIADLGTGANANDMMATITYLTAT
jgi:hypothetical protein